MHVCRDLGDLLRRIEEQLGMPKPDALRVIREHGEGRSERAFLQVVCRLRAAKSGIRSPIGYFVSTLKKGMEWTPDELQLHLRGEL
jgi:hypothetical protein